MALAPGGPVPHDGWMSSFRPYDLDQPYLLPLNLREWLPEKHLALFVNDVIDEMDLAAILRTYQRVDRRGNAAYHPAMMVKLLVYGYCTGRFSSRKIEKACWEDVPFRVLSGNQQPDHDSIADFRKRHLKVLSALFGQVLNLCQQAGLVKLGHVAVDGSKMKANASKHKSMSYDRLVKSEEEIKKQVEALLKEAERVDTEEDALYGKGNRGDELPEELRTRAGRLKKIREAKAALEADDPEAGYPGRRPRRKLRRLGSGSKSASVRRRRRERRSGAVPRRCRILRRPFQSRRRRRTSPTLNHGSCSMGRRRASSSRTTCRQQSMTPTRSSWQRRSLRRLLIITSSCPL